MSLCGNQRLAEQMNFLVNGHRLRDGAYHLAAKGQRILLAQPIGRNFATSPTSAPFFGFTPASELQI